MKLKEWVKAARAHKGWTQQQLGDAVGRTKANVGHWETGKHEPRLELIQAISTVTGYPPLSLDTTKPFDENVRAIVSGVRPYPVISSIQAGLLKEISTPYSPADGFAVEFGDDDASQWAFSLEIEGDSMLPEFRPGDRVLIDPEVVPSPGDYVAVRNTEQKATFKKYRLRGISPEGHEIFEIVPLNENYPSLRSDEHDLHIIGTMLEHRRKYKRK